jgi:pimeloyl-ACP methyl ester carboxylesterase
LFILVRTFKKIIKGFLLLMLSLFIGLAFLLVRFDIPLDRLEKEFFTEFSHYVTLNIMSLENEEIEITLHYQDFGQQNQPVVVLLHGAFASSHTFEPWAKSLVEDGYRVLTIDLPYHGLSGGFSDQITSQRRSAATVKALLDKLNISEVYIGGNSMGGGVSWMFTSEYHGIDQFQVKGLILINAVYPNMTNGNERGGLFRLLQTDFASAIVSKLTPRFLLKNILEGVYGSKSILEEKTVDRYYELLRRPGNRQAILNNQQEVVVGLTGDERLERIVQYGIPTLVIWGDEDSWISVDFAYQFKDALSLDEQQVIIYEGLGHVPMEENPALTYLDLLEFLQNN